MNKWITFSELCKRWDINKYDLADIVISGSLRSFDGEDFSDFLFINDSCYKNSPDGRMSSQRCEPFMVDEVTKLVFRISDVEAYEKKNGITPQMLDTDKSKYELNKESIDAHPALPQTPKSVNFFTNKGSFWHVGYEGETGTIRALDGIGYIATLLQKSGKSISCRHLFQSASGKTSDEVRSEGVAIDEGLNVGRSIQPINDDKAKTDYKSKYLELQNDLEKAESEMEQQEIEKEMETIMPNLKGKTFADPNDKKAQINIKKRIGNAYKAIRKANMKNLEKHLQSHIKTDDAYGLMYIGSIEWEITIK